MIVGLSEAKADEQYGLYLRMYVIEFNREYFLLAAIKRQFVVEI